ncbi:MAG: hypothetical protein EBZ59_12950, partial [Planctomycetia bacterium]|nr:hypothetical protein [Planctomycetia bacterium]
MKTAPLLSALLACLAAACPGPARAFETLRVPAEGAYTGAYCDFGDGEDHVTLESIGKFQELTGKPLAIVGFGSFWARQSFPRQQVDIVRA